MSDDFEVEKALCVKQNDALRIGMSGFDIRECVWSKKRISNPIFVC